MNLKSTESLRPKISRLLCRHAMRREAARAEWVTGMFFLLLLMVLLSMQLELALYRTASAYLEDALAASNLASAVIDPEEYGISHTLRIADTEEAYRRYLKAVEGNLQLGEDWESQGGVISGAVQVTNYTIYNVEEDRVAVWSVNESGSRSGGQGILGQVCAPNGQLIENTSVYSEITFPVRGLFGIQVQAHKGKLVDILTCTGEEKGE